MRILLRAVCFFLFACAPLAATATPLRIADPAKYCEELIARSLAKEFNVAELARTVATTVGRPEGAAELEKPLSALAGKKIDFKKKVLDREIEGALRQILYYVYIDNVEPLYVRFNFKMTSTGWILANFNFKTEMHELFPKDFIDR